MLSRRWWKHAPPLPTASIYHWNTSKVACGRNLVMASIGGLLFKFDKVLVLSSTWQLQTYNLTNRNSEPNTERVGTRILAKKKKQKSRNAFSEFECKTAASIHSPPKRIFSICGKMQIISSKYKTVLFYGNSRAFAFSQQMLSISGVTSSNVLVWYSRS